MNFNLTAARGALALIAAGAAIAATACGGDEEPASPAPAATAPVATAAVPAATATPTPAAPKVVVTGAWARSTPGIAGENSGAYFIVTNEGGAADRLVGASVASTVAKKVELHRTVKVGDTMKMEPVDGWDVPANGKLTLEPGANHVMLLDLPTALKAGAKFPLTLKFEKSGSVTVDVEVRPATGDSMAPGGMGTPAGGMGAPSGMGGASATPAMGR